MAKVPYNPVPDVTPIDPGESISVNTPPEAFGENIANALTHVGTTGEQVGNELFTRAIALQDLANETEARNKVIDFTNIAAQKQADFDSLKGIDSKNALQGHLKDISDLRQSMRGQLSSPMAQKMFDAEAASFQNRVTFSSATRAGDEFKTYATGAADATVQLAKKSFVDPFSESELKDKLDTIEEKSHTVAALQGLSEPKRQLYVLENQTAVRLGQIEQQALRDPLRAYDTLQGAIKNGQIDQAAADKALDSIYVHNRAIGTQNQAKGIFAPGKSLADMDAEAHKISQDQSITLGDPLFEKDLRTAIRSMSIYDKSITTQQKNENLNTVAGAIHSDKYHTVQEMLADPDVGPAIKALPPKEQDKLPEALKQHWSQHDADVGFNNWQQLYGLSQHNPGAFLDTNLYDEKLHLSRDQRGDLINVRKQLTKDPNANPQVQRAISWMAQTHDQELRALGVRFMPPKNADPESDEVKNYSMYIGGLAQAVEAYQQEYQHFPNREEFETKIAKPLLMTHSTSQGTWFGGLMGNRDVPEFERAIPPEIMKGARKDLQEAAIKNNYGADYRPSDNEIRMYIVRKQWDEFYKKAKAAEGGRTGP